MKLILVLLFVGFSASENLETDNQDSVSVDACIDDHEAVQAFRTATDSFSAKFCTAAARKGHYFLTMSAHEVWITLAGIAEGADQALKKELFTLLNLPEDLCSRQKIYQIATTRLVSNNYVSLVHSRVLLIDEGSLLNPHWLSLVQQNSLLQVIQAPIKYDPVITTEIIKWTISSKTQRLNLNGNSVILNSVEYNGLWTTAFADAIVKRAPFYSQAGVQIGSVDLMRVRRKVRIGYLASVNMKIIELPIGVNKEYSVVIGLVVNDNANVGPSVSKWTNNTIAEMLGALGDKYVSIDVAIPRFVMNSEINVRDVLEDMGVTRLWSDAEATKYISTPAALPSSYIQRATLTVSNEGVNPPPFEDPLYPRSDEERYWTEFIADRPFTFGLYDTETYSCIMATSYTHPTYPY